MSYGFNSRNEWGDRYTAPTCPMGCVPCGVVYYGRMEHDPCCCNGGACGSPRHLEVTRQWLEQWLQAEREWKAQVAAWAEAEKGFVATLVPGKPMMVHKPRTENSPAKVKHVKAMQKHAN